VRCPASERPPLFQTGAGSAISGPAAAGSEAAIGGGSGRQRTRHGGVQPVEVLFSGRLADGGVPD